ncbi:MAG TPA: EamA family transporter [Longimicrobiales bacterium]|nr:EamA family transporter [Longimicrobiales bacterium]
MRWWWEGWVRHAISSADGVVAGERGRRRERAKAADRERVLEAVKVVLAFGAIYLIWGSTYYAIGEAVATVPPIFMVVVRGMMAGGVLYLWSRLRGGAPLAFRELAEAVPAAALLFGGGYVLVGWAEQHIASGPASLLNASSPAFVVLLEWARGLRRRPGIWLVGGLAAGVLGVVVLVQGRGTGAGAIDPVAAVALVAASFAWASGSLLASRHQGRDPFRSAAVQLLTGAFLLLPVSAGVGELSTVVSGTISGRSLGALAYLFVLGSVVGYTAYVWLLHHVAASKVASHSYVNPVIAVVLGAMVGGEPLDFPTLVSGSLIAISVLAIVMSSGGQRARNEPVISSSYWGPRLLRRFRRLAVDIP